MHTEANEWLGFAKQAKAELAAEAAAAILALVNSKPSSPSANEVSAVLMDTMAHYSLRLTHPSVWCSSAEDRAQHAIRELWDAVVAEYEEIAAHPSMKEVAPLAKQLCAEERGAESLFDMTIGIRGIGPAIAAYKCAALCLPMQPQWALYIDDARRVLELTAPDAAPSHLLT